MDALTQLLIYLGLVQAPPQDPQQVYPTGPIVQQFGGGVSTQPPTDHQ